MRFSSVYLSVTTAVLEFSLSPALRNGLDTTPAMGWSTWEAFGCNINEEIVRNSADRLVSSGLRDLGYKLVAVDDCWAADQRNATGHLVPNANFSSGIAALANFVHERGMLFGIYSSAGVRCCQNTQPGSLGYEYLDSVTFASWGVDFLKYDGCFMEGFSEVLVDAPRRLPFTPPPVLRYPAMTAALNHSGRNISYMCNFPWQFWGQDKDASMGGRWVGEMCNMWRTGGDAQPGYSTALSFVDQAENYAELVPSGPGAWNHLDSLEIGNNASYDALPGGGAIYRAGGGGMTAAQEHVLTLTGHSFSAYANAEVIAVSQDPLGERGRRRRGADGGGELWSVRMSGGKATAILLNRGEAGALKMSVTPTEIGLPAGDYAVRELWEHKDLDGIVKGEAFSSDVSAGESLTILLTPKI